MFGSQNLMEKWGPVLDAEGTPEIKDKARKAITAVVLENTEKALAEERGQAGYLSENNNTSGGYSSTNGTAAANNWDPILISLVRRAMPNIIAYDIAGVQPMTGPTGLIFAMKAKYKNAAVAASTRVPTQMDVAAGLVTQAQFDAGASIAVGALPVDTEALGLNAPSTSFSGKHTTAVAETMGTSGGTAFAEMAFTIDKTTVTAQTRALKAEYTMELAQDLKAVHGLDAESELANILSTEILAEINREVINTVNVNAVNVTTFKVVGGSASEITAGNAADGRWAVERYKSLGVKIELEANAIAVATRRGKGSFIICSSNVASVLAASGSLDYAPALATGLKVDDTGSLFAGVLNGSLKVFIDPYAGSNYITVGYKGTNAYDAGLFYCPYVPLTMVKTIGADDFQPRIGFKTRYGMVNNPYVEDGAGLNTYFRNFAVSGI
jgi:hypothetical protein